MQEKKPNNPLDDLVISGEDLTTIDLSSMSSSSSMIYDYSINSGASYDTITISGAGAGGTYSLGGSTYITNGTGGAVGAGGNGGGYTIGTGTGGYVWNTTTTNPTVNISNSGIDMASGTDLKIAGRSLKEFMEKMESRLAILVPDPEKLEHFEALRKAYEHYKTLEALCELPKKEEE